MFGVGGYDDNAASRLTQGEMNVILQGEASTDDSVIPKVYNTLRRRNRLLRNGMMYMGPMNGFSDYFAPWAVRPPGGNDCQDECTMHDGTGGKAAMHGSTRIDAPPHRGPDDRRHQHVK